MVEPFCLLVIEAGTCSAATCEVELPYELVHVHNLAVVSGVPAEKREEIDNRLGKVTTLAITRGDVARLRVVPFERKYGKAQTIAVALAQLAVAFGLARSSYPATREVVLTLLQGNGSTFRIFFSR